MTLSAEPTGVRVLPSHTRDLLPAATAAWLARYRDLVAKRGGASRLTIEDLAELARRLRGRWRKKLPEQPRGSF